ncbi:MAG TPA: hypothetical protein VL752_09910 [Acidisoma sp.]|uniref:hypothetical protein n=1 Tax=Acidisoma sp. TaxID=1872115 RepID=UPI002C7CBAF3|nr:hypothetical protein [Acidisoma sp.]HTI01245.1 hypothetical protein [Acidisoma sp.]
MKSTRPLLIAVIVMGVLVIAATSVVIVKLVQDIAGGGRHAPSMASTIVPGAPEKITLTTRMLNQPESSHIVSIATAGDRLAVLINGGGPDRILFVEPATGAVTGQLMLGK